MSKPTKPAKKPTQGRTNLESELESGNTNAAQHEFFMAAMNMSWQLAIVVLVPIIGGFKLDQHYQTLPLWTIVGFILAMIGMAIIVWRQVQLFTPKVNQRNHKDHHS